MCTPAWCTHSQFQNAVLWMKQQRKETNDPTLHLMMNCSIVKGCGSWCIAQTNTCLGLKSSHSDPMSFVTWRMRQPGSASKLGSPTFATSSRLAVWAQPFIAQHLAYQVSDSNECYTSFLTAPLATLAFIVWEFRLVTGCHGFEFGKWHISLFKHLNVTATVWQCFAWLFEKGTLEVTSVLTGGQSSSSAKRRA